MSERDMGRLLALIEKNLGAGWVEISDWLRDNADLDEIERRLLNNDIAGVIEEVQQAALRFAAETHQAYVLAGRETADWLRVELETPVIHFDETNDRAVARAKANQLAYETGLADEQREKIQTALVEGRARGDNPRAVARRIRDGLGLTATQEAAVDSYRQALEQSDFTNALGRELRDGRSDRLLVRLRDSGGSLTPKQVDSIVDRYRSNYIDYRATVIARTEGLKALHEGNEELFRQAIDDGHVEADALVREWNHAGHGGDSRPGHVKLDGTRQPFGEPFENPVTGVKLMYPGDASAPLSETIQCRCAISTRHTPVRVNSTR
jgi:hypothetical protein